MEAPEPAFVAQGPLSRMRELQAILASDAIDAEIVAPPGSKANS